jgi:hypothetical protein
MRLYEAFYLVLLVGLAIFAFLSHRKLSWIETELKKEIFAHSVRFKNEFDVYKYLWEKAAHFARAVKDYHMQSWPPDESPMARALGKMGPLLKEKSEVKETLLNNAPFISDDVKEKAESLITLAYPPELSTGKFEDFKKEVDARLKELEVSIRNQTEGRKNGFVRQTGKS